MDAIEITATILFVEWGIVHIIAFALIGIPAWSDNMSSTGVYGAADLLMSVPEYKKEYDSAVFPRMSGKILFQHGFNLGGWCGVWSCAVPIAIAYQNRMAWVLGLVPYFLDWGYFMAFDWFGLGGTVAQAQTYNVSTAMILTAFSANNRHDDVSQAEFIVMVAVPSCLIFAGILHVLGVVPGKRCGAKTRAEYDAEGRGTAHGRHNQHRDEG
jgi:hypothetical protein